MLGLKKLLGGAVPEPSDATNRTVAIPGRSLTPEAHWDKVASVIEAAMKSAETAQKSQDAAELNLETAEFALGTILDEVRAFMPTLKSTLPQPEPAKTSEAPAAAPSIAA